MRRKTQLKFYGCYIIYRYIPHKNCDNFHHTIFKQLEIHKKKLRLIATRGAVCAVTAGYARISCSFINILVINAFCWVLFPYNVFRQLSVDSRVGRFFTRGFSAVGR